MASGTSARLMSPAQRNRRPRPSLATAPCGLGTGRNSDFDSAKTHLQAALGLAPHSHLPNTLMAQALLREDLHAQAIPFMHTALKAATNTHAEVEERVRLAAAFSKLERLAEAAEHIEAALAIHPGHKMAQVVRSPLGLSGQGLCVSLSSPFPAPKRAQTRPHTRTRDRHVRTRAAPPQSLHSGSTTS